jgi:hypothetical protein
MTIWSNLLSGLLFGRPPFEKLPFDRANGQRVFYFKKKNSLAILGGTRELERVLIVS